MTESIGEGIQEFSFDDPEAESILPFSGLHRSIYTKVTGLRPVVDHMLAMLKDLQVTSVECIRLSSPTAKTNKTYQHPIKVEISIGCPNFPSKATFKKVSHVIELAPAWKLRTDLGTKEYLVPMSWTDELLLEIVKHVQGKDFHVHIDNDEYGRWELDPAYGEALRRCVAHETFERGRALSREIEADIQSGPIYDEVMKWHIDEVRKVVHKALAKFSDLPTELLHQFVDEMAVEEVLKE